MLPPQRICAPPEVYSAVTLGALKLRYSGIYSTLMSVLPEASAPCTTAVELYCQIEAWVLLPFSVRVLCRSGTAGYQAYQ